MVNPALRNGECILRWQMFFELQSMLAIKKCVYVCMCVYAHVDVCVHMIILTILRKDAGNFWQFGKSKRTAIAENHTHSFDRDRLTYPHYNFLRIRAFLAMSVIYIDLAILRKNAGDCWQFGKHTGHREPIKHSSTPRCETQFKQLILNKFQALDNKHSTIHGYSSQTHTHTQTHTRTHTKGPS